MELVLLDVLLERVQALGLLKQRGKQRTDSTHVLAAVRAMNKLERVPPLAAEFGAMDHPVERIAKGEVQIKKAGCSKASRLYLIYIYAAPSI
jgi:hypothetical protein